MMPGSFRVLGPFLLAKDHTLYDYTSIILTFRIDLNTPHNLTILTTTECSAKIWLVEDALLESATC